MRTLYRARRGERAVAALERAAGIVEGYWTPLAARHSAMRVSHLTPREAEEVLATLGSLSPSKSSLDRLPKALSARWEAQREDFETTVREATVESAGGGARGGDLARRGDGAEQCGALSPCAHSLKLISFGPTPSYHNRPAMRAIRPG